MPHTLIDSGFASPERVIGVAELAALQAALTKPSFLPRIEWGKGLAAAIPVVHDVATHRAILEPVVDRLGRDVTLWGASVVVKKPGQIHHYHTDIECSAPGAQTVSVWIGLRNVTRESALRFVVGSHRFGASVQQAAVEAGIPREDLRDDAVLALARSRDSGSEVVQPDMGDGYAVWFDGHVWHASENTTDSTRTALLLQYATPDTPIRIPDLSQLNWPFRTLDAPRPPCVVVRGDAPDGINRIVPPPVVSSRWPRSTTWVRSFELPLGRDRDSGWQPHPVFRVTTPNASTLGCHVSVLEPGVSPHPPHTHPEEEILVVLDGEAELLLERGESRLTVPVVPGDVAYYPNDQGHTLRCTGSRPVTYLMLKWLDDTKKGGRDLDTTVFPSERVAVDPGSRGYANRVLFEGSTGYLRRLQAHVTVVEPGGGYEPHVDAHDVVILLLEGVVETLEAKVEAPAVIMCAGGEAHGMRNAGTTPARYLVFEFHRGDIELDATVETVEAEAATPPVEREGPTVDPVVVLAEPAAEPLWLRVWRGIWRWGARQLAPYPRTKRALRAVVAGLAPPSGTR